MVQVVELKTTSNMYTMGLLIANEAALSMLWRSVADHGVASHARNTLMMIIYRDIDGLMEYTIEDDGNAELASAYKEGVKMALDRIFSFTEYPKPER